MTEDAHRLAEYYAMFRGRVVEASLEEEGEAGAFQEDAFTQVFLETLEDRSQVPSGTVCYFSQRVSRGAQAKANAFHIDDQELRIDLYASLYSGTDALQNVGKTDLNNAARRALRVLEAARKGFHEQMEPASDAHSMLQQLAHASEESQVRIVILVDGLAGGDVSEVSGGGKEAAIEAMVEVWDIRRLCRIDTSSLGYEPIRIDLESYLGAPLPCLPMPESGADYDAYLAIIPGSLLFQLYHEFGSRLLELNVRSFLQARGKVNRGIRDTLRNEPARFLAYNNGISGTAEHVELTKLEDGRDGIKSITGFQVVNGGQTVASIHRAGHVDKTDLDGAFVQAKISVVGPDQIQTLVPLISRYANTQNRVSEADFSANHAFHVKIQKLSERVWAPGEQTRWFYERARGQYQVAKARESTTRARKKKFEARTPSKQKFDKVLLAKYQNSWRQHPHTVSQGGQKNFVKFMERLERLGPDFEPDEEYYKKLIVAAIIFKTAETIARKHKFPGYRANAITFTVALLSYRTSGRVNLGRIWEQQEVTQALFDTLYSWMPKVWEELVSSAGTRNVTEWCKKEECWRHIQTLSLPIPKELQVELDADFENADQLLPATDKLGPEDRENIAQVTTVSAAEWLQISGWGARSGLMDSEQTALAASLATRAAAGWPTLPSASEARFAVRILGLANEQSGRVRVDALETEADQKNVAEAPVVSDKSERLKRVLDLLEDTSTVDDW